VGRMSCGPFDCGGIDGDGTIKYLPDGSVARRDFWQMEEM